MLLNSSTVARTAAANWSVVLAARRLQSDDPHLVSVKNHRPDVVLMDIRMPVMDGITATRHLHDAGGPPVLELTTFDDDDVLWGGLSRQGRLASCSRTPPPTTSSQHCAPWPAVDHGSIPE
ncbi:MAG: response regulator [Actinomycetota bacterium]